LIICETTIGALEKASGKMTLPLLEPVPTTKPYCIRVCCDGLTTAHRLPTFIPLELSWPKRVLPKH